MSTIAVPNYNPTFKEIKLPNFKVAFGWFFTQESEKVDEVISLLINDKRFIEYADKSNEELIKNPSSFVNISEKYSKYINEE